jgi:hypothetical protein
LTTNVILILTAHQHFKECIDACAACGMVGKAKARKRVLRAFEKIKKGFRPEYDQEVLWVAQSMPECYRKIV